MKSIKRIVSGLLVTSILLGMTAVPAYAARKQISSVTVIISSDIQPGMRYGEEDISVEVRNGKCTYDYYDIQNVGFEWVEDDVPEIQVFLRAEEGYYFSLSKASAVKLTGATYVKASKQDSSETLVLTVKLPSLAESVSDQTEVVLAANGVAYWDAVQGAGSYEVRLYRNGVGVGASILTTTENHYDFTSMMNRVGTYHAKIRPVNKINTNNKGEAAESPAITITEDMLAAIKNGTAQGYASIRGEWIHDGQGWWYRHADGNFTKNNWENIKDQWYFFGEDGYMKTGWIEWDGKRFYCDQSSGVMLKNTTTPDGTILDNNGNPKTGI